MLIRFLISLGLILGIPGFAVAASVKGTAPPSAYVKLPSAGTTLKKRAGYWVECSYSGLGENCYYVYARVKNAAGTGHSYQRVKVGNTTLKKRAGYWTECSYTAVGESCYTVYAGGKPK